MGKSTKPTHTPVQKANAQYEYARDNKLPLFAPTNGRCFFCGNQIYHHISYERAANALITSCPYCNYSYCD